MRTPPPGGTLIRLWESTSPIVEVLKCRKLDENRREEEEGKKVTAKKTATRKVHLQLKRSEYFDGYINSMNSLYSSTTDKERLIQLIKQ